MSHADKALMFIRCPSCLMHDADPPLQYEASSGLFRCHHCGYRGTEDEIRELLSLKRKFYPLLKVRNTFGLSQ